MRNIWMPLFWVMTFLLGGVVAYFYIQSANTALYACISRSGDLQDNYVQIVRKQKYILDAIIKINNEIPVKKYMKEYADMSDTAFEAAIRRESFNLQFEIDRIKANPSPVPMSDP